MAELPPPSAARDDDPFYVGYLPLPSAHRRLLRWAVPAMLWSLVFIGFAVVWPQRSPGAGVWESGQPIERSGLLIASPYPILVSGTDVDSASVTILTEMGKRGARERASEHDGTLVTVRGYRLHRDGREILELVPDADAIKADADQSRAPALAAAARSRLTPPPPPSPASTELVTLTGEILDSKCYLGAMKPGDGKAHKACAMLCIRGGIAPMLFAVDASGRRWYWLVLSSDGLELDEGALSLVGERVEVSGYSGRIGDLDVLFREPGVSRAR